MLRDRTHRAWFSRLVRHPARKQSGSILTTPDWPEPARGVCDCVCVTVWVCSMFDLSRYKPGDIMGAAEKESSKIICRFFSKHSEFRCEILQICVQYHAYT